MLDETNIQQLLDNQESSQEQTTSQSVSQETGEQRNWRRLQTERDAAIQRAKELEARYGSQKSSDDDDDDISIGEGDLAEGKHVLKMSRQIRELKKIIKQNQQASAEHNAESLLRSKYPDFDSVVNEQSLKSLREDDPDLAQTLYTAQDKYSAAVSAYKAIKKMGNYRQNTEEEEYLNKNRVKPRNSSSISPQSGDSPLTKAHGFNADMKLDDTLKKTLYKEMMESMKGPR